MNLQAALLANKDFKYKKFSYILAFILVLFVSFDSFSAECLTFRSRTYQENIDRTVLVHYADGETLENCNEDVMLTAVEYAILKTKSEDDSLNQMQETLRLLFEFDPEVFSIVELALILAFLTSHYGGRVARWLGK